MHAALKPMHAHGDWEHGDWSMGKENGDWSMGIGDWSNEHLLCSVDFELRSACLCM